MFPVPAQRLNTEITETLRGLSVEIFEATEATENSLWVAATRSAVASL